jgi:hypothetical protein
MDSSFSIGGRKKKRMSMAKSLEISLVKAQRRNWLNFWTRDGSWIMWNNFLLDLGHHSIMRCLREFDRRAAKESMLTVFFSPAGFLDYKCDAQDITFTAEYFIAQVLTPLHQHRTSLSQDAAR